MNTYLAKILTQVKTIIIPGLGALTVTNERTGEIMFMSYLKFDDGELAKFIAEEEGIELNEAKNQLAKYVREIQATLDKGENFDLFQFGRFTKIAGETTFVPWSEINGSVVEEEPKNEIETSSDSVTEEPQTKENQSLEIEKSIENEEIQSPSLDDILNRVDESEIEIKNEIIPEKTSELHTEKTDIQEIEEQQNDSDITQIEEENKTANSEDKEKIEILPNENAYITPQELEEKEIVTIETSNQSEEKNQVIMPEKPKKGFRFWMLFVILPILFVTGIGIYVIYESMRAVTPALKENLKEKFEETVGADEEFVDEMFDDTTQNNSNETIEKTEEPVVEENVIKEEKIEKPVKQKTPVEKPSVPVSNVDFPFQIIIGSFSSEANAQKLAQSEGAKYLGKIGGMHLVSLGGYNSMQEAQQALKNSGKKGWVKKM